MLCIWWKHTPTHTPPRKALKYGSAGDVRTRNRELCLSVTVSSEDYLKKKVGLLVNPSFLKGNLFLNMGSFSESIPGRAFYLWNGLFSESILIWKWSYLVKSMIFKWSLGESTIWKIKRGSFCDRQIVIVVAHPRHHF